MTSFPDALKAQIEANPVIKRRSKRILTILNAPDSSHRTRQLNRMERHARAQLGVSDAQAIDWSTIDWPTVLETIIKIILSLLAFL